MKKILVSFSVCLAILLLFNYFANLTNINNETKGIVALFMILFGLAASAKAVKFGDPKRKNPWIIEMLDRVGCLISLSYACGFGIQTLFSFIQSNDMYSYLNLSILCIASFCVRILIPFLFHSKGTNYFESWPKDSLKWYAGSEINSTPAGVMQIEIKEESISN